MKSVMLAFVGLFFSIFILIYDGIVGYRTVKQIDSSHYSSTSGQIVQSYVGASSDSEGGSSYSVKIIYSYKVGDRTYRNDRYRYINYTSANSSTITKIVKEFPDDSKVTVFYNPSAPGDSLLAPGFTQRDGFGPIGLLPFNMMMIFFWRVGFLKLPLFRRPEAGGLEVIRHQGVVRLRLVRFSPFAYGSAAVVGSGLLGIVIGAVSSGASTSLRLPVATGLIIVAVGLWVGFRQKNRYASGNYDLIINKDLGEVILPMDPENKQRRSLFLKDIIDVFVENSHHLEGEGDLEYHNKIHLMNPERCEKICHWLGPVESSELADWLSKELGVQRAPDRCRTQPESTPIR